MASLPSTFEPGPDHSACRVCVDLLLDYAAAGNRLIEIQRSAAAKLAPAARRARAQKAEAHRRLLRYRRQIGCRWLCPNRTL